MVQQLFTNIDRIRMAFVIVEIVTMVIQCVSSNCFDFLFLFSFLGIWTRLSICQIIRCDAELLRANPRLVSEWGEVQPLDGGALYAPSSVIAVYTFALEAHCKRCESNGQWSQYALIENCADIKLFRPTTTTTTTLVQKQHRKTI